MVEQDTISLLRECDAGIQMGVSSIDQVLENVENPKMRDMLSSSKDEHHRLMNEVQAALSRFHEDGKAPNPMAKAMSTVKTNMEMMMKPTDSTIADLMTDGCNMGVKSLSKYLNQYAAADEKAKDICKKLISMEEQLAKDLRSYL